ncbi:hypothetical protein D7Z54_07815 [Salibacterium salarium]|uniref:Uncharacterized protein n=1 Tax=Salibacterium salarium TaxID=284579 RepID=A0A428N6B8_9BACI|nr:hypothetical protein [Salibacterium salarium]RSL34010.1 hypothetical protein D7Z54_07815 [Salibacterium salarium]
MKVFKEEKLLTTAGFTGLIIACGLVLYMIWFETIILPEGNVQQAFSFNAAVGLFMLTIAILLPFAEMKPSHRKKVRLMLFSTALISYGIETIQHLRGINPRFSQSGSVIDSFLGALFGIVALFIIIATFWIAIAFFRKKDPLITQPFITSIRYAFLSVMIANVAGIWMMALQGSQVGEGGNIIVLHGLGYHALQALPFVGFLLIHSGINSSNVQTLIHIGGASWLGMILLIFIQTGISQSVFSLQPLPLAAFLCFLAWAVICIWSIKKYLQHRTLSREDSSIAEKAEP